MAPSAVEPPTAVELANNDIVHNLKKNVQLQSNGLSALRIAPLDASKLIITPATAPYADAMRASTKKNKRATDHMISCEWTDSEGWEAPHLMPYAPLELEPSTSCLNYATQCFEGLKLYRGYDGRLRLFRPRLNAERLCRSSARGGMPTFDPSEVEKLILALCAMDGPRYLPRHPSGPGDGVTDQTLLYIRPMMIGTDPDVGIKPPSCARLLIFMATFPSMDQSYLSRPQPGLKLLASRTNEVRAWPGGFGAAKLGANYGPSLVAQREAARQGYDQVLWLYNYPDPLEDDPTGSSGAPQNGATQPRREGLVTEAGASNFFVAWTAADGALELVTAPLTGGLILEGVTRRSVLELAKQRLAASLPAGQYPEVRVAERWFTMADVAAALREGRLLEAFAVGTAYFITPISCVHWRDQDVQIPNGGAGVGPVAERLRKWMKDIKYGGEAHEWAVIVPEDNA